MKLTAIENIRHAKRHQTLFRHTNMLHKRKPRASDIQNLVSWPKARARIGQERVQLQTSAITSKRLERNQNVK